MYVNCTSGVYSVIIIKRYAIENIQKYRKLHAKQKLYVAECDIQKFFDTINHDSSTIAN